VRLEGLGQLKLLTQKIKFLRVKQFFFYPEYFIKINKSNLKQLKCNFVSSFFFVVAPIPLEKTLVAPMGKFLWCCGRRWGPIALASHGG
jgi:hypothetical protein